MWTDKQLNIKIICEKILYIFFIKYYNNIILNIWNIIYNFYLFIVCKNNIVKWLYTIHWSIVNKTIFFSIVLFLS